MPKSRRRFGTVRKLPSKKYQARYVGADGKTYLAPKTYIAKYDAERFLDDIEREISMGAWLSPAEKQKQADSVRKFNEFALEHIALQTNLKGQRLELSTRALYERILRNNLKDFHGKAINEIKKEDVDRWWAKIIGNGKYTTASKAYTLLFSVMNRACRNGLIVSNPCQIVGARGASSNKKVGSPTVDELWQIADVIDPRFRMFVIISGYCALRFSETVALRRQDLKTRIVDGEIQNYEVSVTRALKRANNEVYIGGPKSASGSRTIPVPEWLTPLVTKWLEELVDGDDMLLFRTGKSNTWLRHDVFIKHWNKAIAKCGLSGRGLTPHSLRHFGGTSFSAAGATIPNLKALMGSSSMNSIQRYLHEDESKSLITNAMPKPNFLK